MIWFATAAITVGVVAFAAWMTWRGLHRGLVCMGLRWLPLLVVLVTLTILMRRPWGAWGGLWGRVVCLGVVGAGAYGIARRAKRNWNSSIEADAHFSQARPVVGVGVDGYRWLNWIDQLGGAVLGFFLAATLSLSLAGLASTLVFQANWNREQTRPSGGATSNAAAARTPNKASPWAYVLGRACKTAASFSDQALRRVPVLQTYNEEMQALVVLLNAPPEKLRQVAEKRNIKRFLKIPVIQAALKDPDYQKLIRRIADGDVMAVHSLMEHPMTRELYACPEVKTFAQSVKPSDLAADLKQTSPSPAPASN